MESRILLAAQLLADINTTPASSSPGQFVTAGNLTYFTASDPVHGDELWATDGTSAGTRLVKDISEGVFGSLPGKLTSLNGTLYFTAQESVHGNELWKTDGTEAGTVLVKDVYPGVNSGTVGPVAAANGLVFFVANDGVSGRELWCSDGTSDGTHLVKDIAAGPANGFTGDPLIAAGNRVYFIANDGTNGAEVWSSDGTADGTTMVKDIVPGIGGSSPTQLTAIGNRLFFNATDSTGTHLWVSDGSETGTQIAAGGSSLPYVDFGGAAYYRTSALCKSDGTATGASVIFNPATIPLYSAMSNPVRGGDLLYFWVQTSAGDCLLYKSDGTTAGTAPVEQTSHFKNAFNLFNSYASGPGSQLFFTINRDTTTELWCTDGTSAGTQFIKTMNPSDTGSGRTPIAVNDGVAYFAGTDPATGEELWKSDGTTANTMLVKDIVPSDASSAIGGPGDVAALPDGRAIFAASDGVTGNEPWISGTAPGSTVLLKDVYSGPGASYPTNFISFGDSVYFLANSRTGLGLWKTQGTTESTQLLATITGGDNAFGVSFYSAFQVAGNYLYLMNDGQLQTALWRTDGTPQGTIPLQTYKASGLPDSEAYLGAIGSRIFFRGTSTNYSDFELWTSDGTPQGTVRLKDISAGAGSSLPQNFTTIGNELYFFASDGTHGFELWQSDGTEANTRMVSDIDPDNSGSYASTPQDIYAFNGMIYFSEDDGSGLKLWRSDGTPAGTYKLADIGASRFASIGDRVVFISYDPVHGEEPWVTDGTPQGTRLLKDINPGAPNSMIGNYYFKSFGGALIFQADDGQHGVELWRTDGTEAGTVLLQDIFPGPIGSSPFAYGEAGGAFYFQADNGLVGQEVWRMTDNIPPSVVDSRWTPGKTLRLQFNEDVSASLTIDDVVVRNTATQQAISPVSFTYDSTTNAATFIFSLLPDGTYSVELQAAGISDHAGNLLMVYAPLPSFSVLRGDANGDGSVNFADLVAVAQHYGQSGMTWLDGDFNDDGTVNFADLVAVAQAYGTQLPAPSPAIATAALPASKTAPIKRQHCLPFQIARSCSPSQRPSKFQRKSQSPKPDKSAAPFFTPYSILNLLSSLLTINSP